MDLRYGLYAGRITLEIYPELYEYLTNLLFCFVRDTSSNVIILSGRIET